MTDETKTKPAKPDPDATEFYDPDRFQMARWAPWEWMVYEFEQGLSRAPIKVWPKPSRGD